MKFEEDWIKSREERDEKWNRLCNRVGCFGATIATVFWLFLVWFLAKQLWPVLRRYMLG